MQGKGHVEETLDLHIVVAHRNLRQSTKLKAGGHRKASTPQTPEVLLKTSVGEQGPFSLQLPMGGATKT